MAALDSQHAVADPDDPVGSALGKILRVLPTNVARQAAAVRETARTVPERSSVRPDPEVTSGLVAAVAAQQQVRIGYRTAAGNARTFEVDPWSVVVRYGRWYLLCHSHHADALRTFRIDRITEVELLEDTFDVPADLDPAAALEANLGKGWEHDTHLVFDLPLAEVRPWIRPTLGDLRELPDGRCELVGSTSNPEAYAGEWLAQRPAPVHGGGRPRAPGRGRDGGGAAGAVEERVECAAGPCTPRRSSTAIRSATDRDLLAERPARGDRQVVAAPELARVVPGRAPVVAQDAHLDVAAGHDLGAERRLRA